MPDSASLPALVRIVESPTAPNPRRLRMFLAEKGVDVPRESVDIMAGEHQTEEYVAWAGQATVPAAELADGTVITETMAICRYVEALYPVPSLFGAGPLEAAKVEMWQRRVELGLLQHVVAIVRHTNPKMAALEEQVPQWGEANRPRLHRALRSLDHRLQANPFIAGADYSIADITAQVTVDFMRVAREEVPEDCLALRVWREKVSARPSANA